MGANRLGDIRELCDIAEPSHGLITNIGKAHIGTFGGVENILRGKTELYQHLVEHEGTVFIPKNDSVLINMVKRFDAPVIYSEEELNIQLKEAKPYIKFSSAYGTIQTQLMGQYNFNNILTALAVGKYFNVKDLDMYDAIKEYFPDNMRSQVIQKESNTILLDAYNANPSSMKVAIDNLMVFDQKEKAVILGDMLELGEDSPDEHQILAQSLIEKGIQQAYLVGAEMGAINLEEGFQWFENYQLLGEYLQEHPIENTTVLIKGSRSVQLEKVLDYL